MARHSAPDTRVTAFAEAETAYQQTHLGRPWFGDKVGRHLNRATRFATTSGRA